MSASTLPPIFILSCERSGSTLLRLIMDGHPELCCPPHLYLGELCQALQHALYFSTGQALAADEARRAEIVRGEIREYVGGFMARYCAAKGKRRWCEKTPMNLDHLPLLAETFPEARFVCLYRHGLDVAQSALSLSRYEFIRDLVPYVRHSPDNLVAAMLRGWLEKTGRLYAFEREQAGRCVRLRYEDLVADPGAALAGLFAGLELPWEADWLDQGLRQAHDLGEGDVKAHWSTHIRPDSVGKGATLPRHLIPAELLGELDALLGNLGYPGIDGFYRRYLADAETGPDPIGDDAPAALDAWLRGRLADCRDALPPKSARIVATGTGGGAWLVGPEEAGASPAIPDCVIELPAGLLRRLMTGAENPMVAYEAGGIQIRGDHEAAFAISAALLA